MNKSIEQMILEELINEARNKRRVEDMPDDYIDDARGTFGDMVDDRETLETIWLHYGPDVIHYTSNQPHKMKLKALGGNQEEVDKEDLEILKQTAQEKPNINSIDDLLDAATQRVASNQTDQPQQDNQTQQSQTDDQTQEPQAGNQDDDQEAQEQALLQKSVDTYKKSLNNFLDEIEQVETAQKEDEMVAALYQQLLKLYNELKEPERDERTDQRVLRREGILREEVNKKGLKLRLAKILRQYKEIKKLLKDFIDVAKSGQFKRERLLKEFLKEVRLFAVYIKTAYKNLPDVQNESLITEDQAPYEIFSSFIDELRTQQDAPFADKQALLDRLKDIIVKMKKDILPLFYSVKPFISSGAYKDKNELLDYTEEFTNLYKRHIVNAVSDLRPFLNDDDPAEGFSEAVGAYKTALTDFRKGMLDLFGVQIDENNEAEVIDTSSSEQQPLSQRGGAETSTAQPSTTSVQTNVDPGVTQQTNDSDQAQTDDADQAQTDGGNQLDSDSVLQQPTQDDLDQYNAEDEEIDFSEFTEQQEATFKFLEDNGIKDPLKGDWMLFGDFLQNYINQEQTSAQIDESQDQQSQERAIQVEELLRKAFDKRTPFSTPEDSIEDLAKSIVRLENQLKEKDDFEKYFPIDKAFNKLSAEVDEAKNKAVNSKKMRRLVDYRNLFVRIFKPEDFESELKKVFGDGLGQRAGTFAKGLVMESTDKNKKLNESLFIGSLGVLGLAYLTNKIQQRGAPKDIEKIIDDMVYKQKGVFKYEPLLPFHSDNEKVYKIDDPKKFELVKKTLDGFQDLRNKFFKAEKEDVEGFMTFLVDSFKKVNELLNKSDSAKPISGKSFIEIIALLPADHMEKAINDPLKLLDKAAKNSEKVEKTPKEEEYYFNKKQYGDEQPDEILKILNIEKNNEHRKNSDYDYAKYEKYKMVPDSDGSGSWDVMYYLNKDYGTGKTFLANFYNDKYKKLEKEPKIVEYDPPRKGDIYEYTGDKPLGDALDHSRGGGKIEKNKEYKVVDISPISVSFQTNDDEKFNIDIKMKEWNENKKFFKEIEDYDDEFDSIDLTDYELEDTFDDSNASNPQPPNTNEQIQKKLEIIIEQFINKRKQQWQKRTM